MNYLAAQTYKRKCGMKHLLHIIITTLSALAFDVGRPPDDEAKQNAMFLEIYGSR